MAEPSGRSGGTSSSGGAEYLALSAEIGFCFALLRSDYCSLPLFISAKIVPEYRVATTLDRPEFSF
jgi:hypothetical protein